MEKLEKICNLKHDLIDIACDYIKTCGGVYSDLVKSCELGQVIDMIKDLASTEKDCVETEYYATVIDAMDGGSDRPGYDRWRYASGRYAPKGHGTYTRGYNPTTYDGRMPIFMDDMTRERMGYPAMTKSQTGRTNTYRSGYPAYNDYQDARRHYHETGDHNAKEVMNHKSKEYMDEISDTVHEMWDEASPEQKKQLKSQMSKLLAELAV